MVSNDENPNCVTHNTKQKVVGKTIEVDAANVALANKERFWPFCGFEHEPPPLGVKVVRELPTRDALVIRHDDPTSARTFSVQDEFISAEVL